MTKKEATALQERLERIRSYIRPSMMGWCKEQINELIEDIQHGNVTNQQDSTQRKIGATHHEPRVALASTNHTEVSSEAAVDFLSDWED